MGVRICNVRPGREQFVHQRLDVDGVGIPLIVGTGPQDGPTLLVVCAQHRNEWSGPAVADRLLNDFDLARLRGSIVILPIASVLQVTWLRGLPAYHDRFDEAARKALDGTNMNRVWPGKADGNFIERSAHVIYEEVCRKVDAIIDFHCCRTCDGRFTAAAEGHAPSLDLAKAFGSPVIDLASGDSYAHGLLYIVAGPDLGIPAILVETHPGGGQVSREMVEHGYRGVLNALIHLGMMRGRMVLPPRQAVFRRADPVEVLKAEVPGFLGTLRAPGDVVKRGELLCVVRGLDTFEVVQEVRAPRAGGLPSVGAGTGNWLVLPGEEVCTLKRVHEVVENR